MPLITPPFRTSLLTANGVPFSTGNGDMQTTRDWWLYWNQLTDQGNRNSLLATEGTHADRPENMPDGALYYESDRGVLYAHADGHWQYAAGTMYGTISPDQRPTDLGTHDAGFEFRGTDVARQFIWSQTAWVEVTAVQYGTHAARPNPATIVEGALYVESDRGGVIYQRETPAGTPLWQYLAGTMYGTLSPDQRPTGLGTHDAGFNFRTTDTDPSREFIWSQTAWVETTPVLLTYYASSTADLNLTGSIQDVPGATVTVTRPGRYYAMGTAWFKQTSVNPGVTGICLINAAGANLVPSMGFITSNAAANSTGGSTASQTATFTISSAPQVVKLAAFQNSASPALLVGNSYTTLLVVWIGP